VKIRIPNQRMKEKLEALLSDVPGEFEHYPERVAGFDQLVIFRNNGIPCPDFTVEIAEARKWVALGNDVFGRNRVHETRLESQGFMFLFCSSWIPASAIFRTNLGCSGDRFFGSWLRLVLHGRSRIRN